MLPLCKPAVCTAPQAPAPRLLTGLLLPLQGQDLATGNLTAPAVYALQTAVGPELGKLIKGGFDDDETGTKLMQALHLVAISGGIDRSRELARQEADMVSAA